MFYKKVVSFNFGFDSLGNEQNFLSYQKAGKLMNVTRNKLFTTELSMKLILLMKYHYKNIPMQYTAIFQGCKNYNFQMKKCSIFHILLKTLRGGSNEYPRSVFYCKNKKIMYTPDPCEPQFYFIKVGSKGLYFTQTWHFYIHEQDK